MLVELRNKDGSHAYRVGDWMHGTYNSTLWLGNDEDSLDLYHWDDLERLELSFVPDRIRVLDVSRPITLHFYHGRETIDQEMNEWGSDGPRFVVREFSADRNGMTFRKIGDGYTTHLHYTDELILWDGVYYGDFEVSDDS